MFTLGILVGIYSYTIFFLGVTGLLYLKFILPITILFLLIILFILKNRIQSILELGRLSIVAKLIFLLLIAQAAVNFIGTLGPELSFDALWYHLTLPKLYLQNHAIAFFPGWLLYYSAMPKLTEMLYTAGLFFGNEVVAKSIHYIFGILVLVAIYKLAKKYVDSRYALIACIIFYSNLVVGWLSITAYIDLARTFYELLTFWAFLLFFEKKEVKYLYVSAVFLGLTISTKLIALGSLLIYIPLLLKKPKNLFTFLIISFLIPLPWFIFSYIRTGNPVYPVFSNYLIDKNPQHLLNLINFIRETWNLFTHAADPINPIYIIFLPFIVLFLKRLKKEEKLFALYSLFGIIVWYVTPRTGGGRFIVPYLPVASILVVVVLNRLPVRLKKYSIALIIFISVVSIVYRGYANKKYIPVILGKQTKSDFLSKNLNFKFGDFYDSDGYFAKTIEPTDKVLIYGIHNLYYVDFPFIHESYLTKEDWFNYILIGDGQLPQQYSNWILIYQNNTNNVKLYALP